MTAALYAVLLGATSCWAASEMRVTGDRVNLRAAPDDTSEVVSQASRGDTLLGGEPEGEWVAVFPPDAVDLWVYAELVKDGVVAVSKLRVRSGPGISYRAVGRLTKGSKVAIRGRKEEWLKIAPPPGCLLWINRRYVELAAPTPVAPEPLPKSSPLPTATVSPAPVAKPAPTRPPVIVTPRYPGLPRTRGAASGGEAPPRRITGLPTVRVPAGLVASMVQGKRVTLEGTLQGARLVWRRPSRYRLVREGATACYVLASDRSLSKLAGHRLEISGKSYWIQGVRHPSVLAGEIRRIPSVSGPPR